MRMCCNNQLRGLGKRRMSTLWYSKEHEYVRKVGNNEYYIGITKYASENLGDIVYAEVNAEPGDNIVKEENYGMIESVKSSSDLVMPLDATVIEVNEEALTDFDQITENPEETWLCKVEFDNQLQLDTLMTREEYDEYISD